MTVFKCGMNITQILRLINIFIFSVKLV